MTPNALAYLLLSGFLFLQISLHSQLVVEKFDSSVNTNEYEEIGPVISPDGRTLYFTRVASPDFINQFNSDNRNKLKLSLKSIFSQISGRTIKNAETSDFNQDIWYVELDARQRPIETYHQGFPLNNAYPNSVCSVYPRENALIVINQFDDEGNIYQGFSKIKKRGKHDFEKPLPMHINDFEEDGENVNMSMSRDGQHLFISMKRKDTKGKNDLYVSVKIGENLWSTPKKLEGEINTHYNETSPFISKDKTVLLFSSNRPGGYGGQDLYISKRLDYSYTRWSTPERMEAPINGPFDDFLACISDDKRYVYFSSNRDGQSDIFYVDLERQDLLPKPFLVKLKIIDGLTNKETRAEIFWKEKYVEDFEGFFRAYIGEFDKTLIKNKTIVFEIKKRGYQSEILEVDPWDLVINDITSKEYIMTLFPNGHDKPKEEESVQEEIQEQLVERSKSSDNLNIPVEKSSSTEIVEFDSPIKFNKERRAVLDNIYFKKGTADVLRKSLPAIEDLVTLLRNHPNIEILIEGHTDNVGDKDALRRLSQKRADSIKKYLMSYGILGTRIYTIGKGADDPMNANLNEDQKRANRRVEIRLLKE